MVPTAIQAACLESKKNSHASSLGNGTTCQDRLKSFNDTDTFGGTAGLGGVALESRVGTRAHHGPKVSRNSSSRDMTTFPYPSGGSATFCSRHHP